MLVIASDIALREGPTLTMGCTLEAKRELKMDPVRSQHELSAVPWPGKSGPVFGQSFAAVSFLPAGPPGER